jgi:hypothetical protein
LTLLRVLCGLIDHRGPGLILMIDESGEFEIMECERCRTVTVRDLLDEGHTLDDFEAVLDRWLDK